jgi:ABC-type transporter Mla MlaB component
MLRISEAGTVNKRVILKLEGRIAGPWVAEMLKACEQFLREHRTLQLDLADVSFLDQIGTAAISSLKLRGVFLENCSPFVTEQLKNT